MRKSLIYTVFLCLILGCGNNYKPEKPTNLISKDKMVDVMIDIALVTSAKGVNKKKLENKNIHPEKYIYQKHEIDSLQFALSNDYYASDSKVYIEILNKVTKRLQELKEKYNKLAEQEANKKRKQDSVARAKKFSKKTMIDDFDPKKMPASKQDKN